MTIQPVLVPCQGSADLFVTPDPADPGMLLIHWGTALLQRVPRDGSDPLLRLTAGLLYNLRFPLRMLDECLPLCGKTIRSIGRSLRECSRAELVRWILGRSNQGALSADQKQYVRVRYAELRLERRDYRKAIRSELASLWGCEVCGDVLRRCFREVDAEAAAGKAVDGGTACSSPPESDAGAEGNSGCASAPLPSTATRNVSSVCGVATPQAEPMLQADAADAGAGAAETTDRPEAAEPDAGAEGNSGCASAPLPSTATRNGSSVPAAAPSPMDAVRAATPGEGLAPLPELAPAPWPIPFPTIPERGQWCAHAGLSLLLPWLEEALGDVPPPLQQLAMQILAGAVNHESSRYTSFESLRLLGPAPHRSTRSQRKWCKKNASDEILNAVFNGNWRLVKGSREPIFYFDPHTEEYTGLLKLLYGWSGAKHGPVKAIHLDFIHTAAGFPCHVLHFDNYDDMRLRFLVSRGRLKARFGIVGPVAWIVDRGIWSKEFLRHLNGLGDTFLTWEKGYTAEGGDWDLPSTGRGKFSRYRCRNNRRDRLRYCFRWKVQEWDVVPNGRRVIVRARKPSGAVVEVAIVTNNPELSVKRIVWLMFNRWIQESDFLYLRRHFGIGEMTERGHDAYADIASELTDRQVESRDHKQATKERGRKRGELAGALLQQRSQDPVGDLDELKRESEALRPRLAEHEEELQRLRAAAPDRELRGPLDRLGRKIGDTAASIVGNREARERARQAGATEKRICELEREIERVQARIEEIPRTESRIQALIDQQYVRLRMRSRPLVDAVRITCRNIFRRPMDIFRPLFDNRRTDHAVFRALTRAPGIISATPERIDVRLIPTMTIEPAEREPIRRLLEICEHRAAAMAALQGGPALHFHLMLDNGEINKFLRTM